MPALTRFTVAALLSLAILLLLQISTVAAQCQGCIDDVVHAVPGCAGVDNSKKEPSFHDYPQNYQQCMCNLGLNTTVLKQCNGQCSSVLVSEAIAGYESMYAMYCNGTAMANGGPATTSQAVGSTSSQSLIMVMVCFSVATVASLLMA